MTARIPLSAKFMAVSFLIIALLNVMLHTMVIRRVKHLSKLADEVSLGHLEALLCPDLFIIGRAETEDATVKLKRAGADLIITYWAKELAAWL